MSSPLHLVPDAHGAQAVTGKFGGVWQGILAPFNNNAGAFCERYDRDSEGGNCQGQKGLVASIETHRGYPDIWVSESAFVFNPVWSPSRQQCIIAPNASSSHRAIALWACGVEYLIKDGSTVPCIS